MSLSQRLSPFTARLAHILAHKKANRTVMSKWNVENPKLAIFFGGPVGDIYQVRQWLSVFAEIQAELPTVLLVKDAVVALELAKTSPLPIRIAGSADAVEQVAAGWNLKAIFYVNNNLANFSILRIPTVRHIHLSHGESEKASMTSNQLKAYDYCFVAGQASANRILSALTLFDTTHIRLIGRPQLDYLLSATPLPAIAGRRTVLYAPTWEGDRPAMAYSSLTPSGERWVAEILADPTLRLIYRPHPKTGTRSKIARGVNERIQKAIDSAPPADGHLCDLNSDYNSALMSADIGLFDVSAMAMDFSVLDRPYLVACPRALEESLSGSHLWSMARKVMLGNDDPITAKLQQALLEGPLASAKESVASHFGDITSGRSSRSFKEAILSVM